MTGYKRIGETMRLDKERSKDVKENIIITLYLAVLLISVRG